MVTTIQKLQEAKAFKVESWSGVKYDSTDKSQPPVRKGGYKDSEYTFEHENGQLYVKGDVFGSLSQHVGNAKEVLFHLAKGSKYVRVKLDDKGPAFTIFNPVLRFEE